MLKILALLVLIFIFFKAVGMVFRLLLGTGDVNRTQRYSSTQSQRKREGSINVDHNPNSSNKGYKGGEYVDYEEVNDK